MKTIEIIIAVRNEENSISNFIENIKNINAENTKIKLLFIEDGSTDNTINILEKYSTENPNIKFISIENPFGQGMALSYGIIHSSPDSDAVITIDIDGSHPIQTVNQMISMFNEGFEIVQGNRIAYDRKYLYRKIGSKIYFIMFSFFTGVNLYRQNVHFRLMSKNIVSKYKTDNRTWFSVRLKNEYFINKKVHFVDFVAPEREIGNSKFNFKRLLNFAYLSFLTLTDPAMFILLNILVIIPAILTFLYLSKYLVLAFAVLIVINIIYYIRVKNFDYLSIVRKKN